MEVESEDEDDERGNRNEGHPSQPDQDTQVQDMDEVRADEDFETVHLQVTVHWYNQPVLLF